MGDAGDARWYTTSTGSSTVYGSTMSTFRCTYSGSRMCSMFASEPVSRLSTQMTRCPRRRSSSLRCEPRNPAPPVTRQVAMAPHPRASARRSLGGVAAHTYESLPFRYGGVYELLLHRPPAPLAHARGPLGEPPRDRAR